MTYYILGINSFIGKNYYLFLRKSHQKVIQLSHNSLHLLKNVIETDTLINFCGVNRANSFEEYDKANHLFVQDVVSRLNGDSLPTFVHVSSYMVNGFEDVALESLPQYQRFFIESKLEGERYLTNNYPSDKLCIVRPSNIYGYNCEPYYNNLLVTMIYEKITNTFKITKINSNCERNFLSIEGLIKQINNILTNKQRGIFNLISDQNVTLDKITEILYGENLPGELAISPGEKSVLKKEAMNGGVITETESLMENMNKLEQQMRSLLALKKLVSVEKRDKLSQARGDMVEISNLNSRRLYMITLTDHSVRGNHYHFEQVEDFFIHRGTLIFLLAHKDDLETIYFVQASERDRITVSPSVIHTLVNDHVGQIPEIFITSTFPYIPNSVPDTVYVTLI